VRTFLIVLIAAIAIGCADTPDREDSDESSSECGAWKIEVIEDGRIVCVDEIVREREREISESNDNW
jgi:hypothetical protein